MSENIKTYIPILATLILALGLFFTGSKVVKYSRTADQDVIHANVTHLTDLEAETAESDSRMEVNSRMHGKRDASENEHNTRDGVEKGPEKDTNIISEEKEQRKILALYRKKANYAKIRKWFNGNVIVGDSIAEAATGYGFLDHSINYAEIGVTAETGKGQVNRAIAVAPKVLIMSFGVNDIENDKLKDFIAHYRARISKVKKALPNTKLYVHTIFPPIKGLEKKLTFYQKLDKYNGALKKLCNEMNVPVVDGSFILAKHQNLFDADGIHPLPKFYHLWLTYLADVTGVSHE